MKMRAVRLFVDACRAGSLSAAAARNGMTVQNVSKAVLDLERETGLRLLERGNSGVVPTAAGLALLPSAELALKAFSVCEAQAGRLARLADPDGGLARDRPRAGPGPAPGRGEGAPCADGSQAIGDRRQTG